MSFYRGFQDELEKIAKVKDSTMAWAFSRGVTTGASAALASAMMTSMYNKSKPKEQRTSPFHAAAMSGSMASMLGLGRGFAEKGLEHKILKTLRKTQRTGRAPKAPKPAVPAIKKIRSFSKARKTQLLGRVLR